jgi:hypothetical protein
VDFISFAMEGKLFLGQYLICVILLLGQLHGYKSCIEKERKALLELKAFLIPLNAGEWNDNVLSWTNDTKSDCCQWMGVECNRKSGRITNIAFGIGFIIENPLLNLSLLHPFEDVRSLDLSSSRSCEDCGFSGLFDDVEGTPGFYFFFVFCLQWYFDRPPAFGFTSLKNLYGLYLT